MSKIYDAIIVGGGPAGLSAAIYLARAKYSVLVLEKEKFGGQITITSDIVNYPGVLEDSGEGLTIKMRKQAENFGASFQKAHVKSLHLQHPIKKVETDQGIYESVGLVLAPGAHPRKLGFPGEREYQGRGIAYCATCDGEFFEGCPIFVIGGGFAACEEALFLTQYASKVTMIVREEDFTCAKTIADQVLAHDQIETIFETEIVEVGGHDTMEYAVFRNNRDQSLWRYDASTQGRFGIFVFAGYVPQNELFQDQLALNAQGYLITDRHQKTSMNGVYGAGDICEKDLRQVVTAVSDGAIAATSLEKYVEQEEITITYLRGNKENTTLLSLYFEDGMYKTGLYVKDGVTGIGTLTFIDPATNTYGALGHEVLESTTSKIVEVRSGSIFENSITSIDSSANGDPGSKNAKFYYNNIYGDIDKNTKYGIYGTYTKEYDDTSLIEVADSSEVKIGPAVIYTVLEDEKVEKFEIEITKINENSEIKNISFEITDQELLDKTGGVVQGMSGSPIVQNDKLIGAVTHVVTDNVTTGYGLFITTMLEESEK